MCLQKHHAAREVFLTEMVDNNDIGCLWKPVQVCLPAEFEKAAGDDVYLCEYEYDTQFQVKPAQLAARLKLQKFVQYICGVLRHTNIFPVCSSMPYASSFRSEVHLYTGVA